MEIVSDSEDSILEETLDSLFRNQKKNDYETSGLQIFNRLLAKSILGRDPELHELLEIQKNQIRSYREKKTTEELREIQQSQTNKHARANPRNEDDPIVIVKHEGIDRLLDGSNRINKWFNEGNTEKHKVNMHEIF